MYIISAEFKVKNEFKEQLIKMALELVPLSEAEPGCISYRFFEDLSEEGKFLFFERWVSREAIGEHFEKSHFHAFAEKFPSMIEGEASIEIHNIAATEAL